MEERQKMGVRDTNTRDTYSSSKIESNYRQGAKKKMRGGEKEGVKNVSVEEEEVTGMKCQ